jgi:hypothetical protein
MIILYQNCEPTLAKDKKLPRDSYIISYVKDNISVYDIARGSKVELFDYYYDNFHNVNSITWTDGTINPKVYDYIPKENKKKR